MKRFRLKTGIFIALLFIIIAALETWRMKNIEPLIYFGGIATVFILLNAKKEVSQQ